MTTGIVCTADLQTVDALIARYQATRAVTERFCDPMEIEDYVIQSMPDVSPMKWHLAHTTWFFEAFLLRPHDPTYEPLNPQYNYLFNSYYNAVGAQFCRLRRGDLSRPTVREIYQYRHYVNDKMVDFMSRLSDDELAALRHLLLIGINHEQQHQELMVADIKHVLAVNPLRPGLHPRPPDPEPQGVPGLEWLAHGEGVYEIGYDGTGFHFDNEAGRHNVYVYALAIGSRLVTNQEYLAFMEDDGYQRAELWLSLGWATICERQGGNCDVEGVSPRNVECMFEVKAIGQEDNDFLRVVDSLQGHNSADIISPYTASNYILFRAYEAAKKLRMGTKVPIACLVVAEETWYRFDIPLQKNWMRWESPRFFEDDVGWQKAIQRNKWSYPGGEALQSLFSGLNIWIVKRNADFQYSLHQTVSFEACGEQL